jgi:hypothetical protein
MTAWRLPRFSILQERRLLVQVRADAKDCIDIDASLICGATVLPSGMQLFGRFLSYYDLREALDHALPGIIDKRSWVYWNSELGRRYPAPPMPERQLG